MPILVEKIAPEHSITYNWHFQIVPGTTVSSIQNFAGALLPSTFAGHFRQRFPLVLTLPKKNRFIYIYIVKFIYVKIHTLS